MIVENEKTFTNKEEGSYIALGSFDGLHEGHISLVKKVVSLAKENKCLSVIYTFSNHPRKFLNPSINIKLLLDKKNKIEILESNNVDLLYFEQFNNEFMAHTPEEFIKYLCEKFKVKGIVVGFNYKFGYKNLGDTKLLKKLSTKYNYELYVMKPCSYQNDVISSTRIREAISNGNIQNANRMLGRPYILNGIVTDGKKIGRQIGFPTANLKYNEEFLLPAIGVYYTNIIVKNKLYKGITNIGNNPTVFGENITIESHILDFSEDIYGEYIEILFIKKIRDQVKFDSLEELKKQLVIDKLGAESEEFNTFAKNIYNK